MRIGLISQSFDTKTGIGRIVRSLASEFLALGHDVSCAAQSFEGVDRRIVQQRVPSISSSKAVNKVLFRLSGSPFKTGDVDIADTFGVGRAADVVTAQSCHRAGMKMLCSQGDRFLERRSLGLYDRVSLNDERYLLTSPSTIRIVAVSQLVKAQIESSYGIQPDRIAVVPNGVNYSMFEELRATVDRANLRVSLALSPDDFVILFMGNEFGRKGLKGLLEALAAFRERAVRLLVVGGGDVQAYGKFAAELGIAGHVRFMGSVSSPENLYLAADAFVLPTLYEPFGIVIIEAMAAGVPVITSRLSGATEGMKDRHHALLLERPASVEELVETIGLVRKDETMRRNLIVAGLEKAKEFSWDKIARRVLAVYDDVRRERVRTS